MSFEGSPNSELAISKAVVASPAETGSSAAADAESVRSSLFELSPASEAVLLVEVVSREVKATEDASHGAVYVTVPRKEATELATLPPEALLDRSDDCPACSKAGDKKERTDDATWKLCESCREVLACVEGKRTLSS